MLFVFICSLTMCTQITLFVFHMFTSVYKLDPHNHNYSVENTSKFSVVLSENNRYGVINSCVLLTIMSSRIITRVKGQLM